MLASPLILSLEITMDFLSDWTWRPQLADKSSSTNKLLTSVITSIFESGWTACAVDNDLEVSTKIKYSKGEQSRARRATSSSTTVTIIMDFNSIENKTNINTPEDINTLEGKLMAELKSDLLDAAEINDDASFLPSNFTATFSVEPFLSFESYDEPVRSTTVTPTTIETNTNSVDNEKIVEIESHISQITHDMEKLSIVDIDLVDEVSELKKVISDLKNQIFKKVKLKNNFFLNF